MVALLLLLVPVAEARWSATLACPKVSVPGVGEGTGVVVGTRDGFAYLLTANHVATSDRVEVEFSSRQNYPRAAWYGDGAVVVARWPDPDVALVRFPLKKHTPSVLPLAPAWQRPKSFPAPVLAVGVGAGAAATAVPDAIVAKEFVRRDGREAAFFWRSELAPERGRSGGPLLDARNRVVGITAAVRAGAGYHAHHDEIVAALKCSDYGWLVPQK